YRERGNEKLEPAGGIERSTTRIQFGHSTVELHRPSSEPNSIPLAAQIEQRGDRRLGKNAERAAMEPARKDEPARRRQGPHVARNAEFFEPVAALEFRQRVVRALVAVGVLPVRQKREPVG